ESLSRDAIPKGSREEERQVALPERPVRRDTERKTAPELGGARETARRRNRVSFRYQEKGGQRQGNDASQCRPKQDGPPSRGRILKLSRDRPEDQKESAQRRHLRMAEAPTGQDACQQGNAAPAPRRISQALESKKSPGPEAEQRALGEKKPAGHGQRKGEGDGADHRCRRRRAHLRQPQPHPAESEQQPGQSQKRETVRERQ